MAIRPTPGRSLVTGRALHDLVRTATLGSYGVTGFAGGSIGRVLELHVADDHPGPLLFYRGGYGRFEA